MPVISLLQFSLTGSDSQWMSDKESFSFVNEAKNHKTYDKFIRETL